MSGNYIANERITQADAGIDHSPFLLETGLVPWTAMGGLYKIDTDGSYSIIGPNGAIFKHFILTELLTIAASATSTTTIQKPANSIILAVPVRVVVALPVTTNFTVGDAGSATRFSTAAVSKAINSTDPGTQAGAFYNSTAQGIVITPDSTPSNATGRVRVTIFGIQVTPPTS